VAPLEPSRVPALRERLARIQRDPGGNPELPLARSGLVHFASFVILDRDPGIPPVLVFDVAHDGEREALLDALDETAGPGLDAVFAACLGYPGPAGRRAFVLAHIRRAAGAHLGYPGRSVRGIGNDRSVRRALVAATQSAAFRADAERTEPEAPPVGVLRRRLQAAAAAAKVQDPELTFGPTVVSRWRRSLALVADVPGAVWRILALVLVGWMLQKDEVAADSEDYTPPLRPLPRPGEVDEDEGVQNQLTHVVAIRPGRLRWWALMLGLDVVDRLSRHIYNRGDLGGIPTIHFARWVMLRDPEPRLLFLSNYDHSWDSYLGDFIERIAPWLTLVWSHTRGFPPTRHLMRGGAAHAQAFKAWTRRHQVPAQVWYRAHPDETVTTIWATIGAREGLEADGSARAAERWMGRL
jgi:hypothetical protein